MKDMRNMIHDFISCGERIPDMMMEEDVEIYDQAVLDMERISEELKNSEEGRQALLALTAHRNIAVRTRSAAACSDFAREHAVTVLRHVCELRVGQMSMDAMHSLMAIGAFDMKTGFTKPSR